MIETFPSRLFSDITITVFDTFEVIGRAGEFEGWLDSHERERMGRYKFDRDRQRYLAGHGMLRELLAGRWRCDPAAIRYAYNPQGKPSLVHIDEPVTKCNEEGKPPGVRHFNTSNSHGRIAIALSQYREVGVDIEKKRPLEDLLGMAELFCNRNELRELAAAPGSEERLNLFFDLWTRKEAALKAHGMGLGQLSEIDEYSAAVTIEKRAVHDFLLCLAVRGRPESS